jgi:hypothetical protein
LTFDVFLMRVAPRHADFLASNLECSEQRLIEDDLLRQFGVRSLSELALHCSTTPALAEGVNDLIEEIGRNLHRTLSAPRPRGC